MTSSQEILHSLIEEANAAKAHYQVWWALRNLALPDFYSTMNNEKIRLFFHASNSGSYKLIFVALGKIFDTDTRASGLRSLKAALRLEGHSAVARSLETQLDAVAPLITRIMSLRNRTIIHNENNLSRQQAYMLNGGITANNVRDVISAVGDAINDVADAIRCPIRVTVGNGFERATLAMLDKLRVGQTLTTHSPIANTE